MGYRKEGGRAGECRTGIGGHGRTWNKDCEGYVGERRTAGGEEGRAEKGCERE